MYICVCQAVTERQITVAVNQGARTLKDLRRELGVASECGRCASCANQCLKKAQQAKESSAPALFPTGLVRYA